MSDAKTKAALDSNLVSAFQPLSVFSSPTTNRAGKLTLLKVLSRITEPTTGRVQLKGRVASLLEVGTGFHPELTRGENTFLSGAIPSGVASGSR